MYNFNILSQYIFYTPTIKNNVRYNEFIVYIPFFRLYQQVFSFLHYIIRKKTQNVMQKSTKIVVFVEIQLFFFIF